MKEPLRLMIVGGHPADVFDHCGGTMAHHIQAGDQVTCLAITQGLKVHDVIISEKFRHGISPEDLVNLERIKAEREAVKNREVLDACACVGVTDVRFLRFEEKVLLEREDMIDAIAQVIRQVRPHMLITHYPYEGGGVGQHHATAAKMVVAAAGLAATTDFDFPDVPAWRVAKTFFMWPCANKSMIGYLAGLFAPYCSLYIDITDVAEKKVRALDCMKSQQYEGAYARKRTEVCEGAFGHSLGVGYAEAFIPATPDLAHLLPISELQLQRASEQELETRARQSVMIAPFVPEEKESGRH